MSKLTAFTLLLGFLFSLHGYGQEMTSAITAPMKDCHDKKQFETLFDCFTDESNANHGFKMLHQDANGEIKQTKYVALLIHGLSDSPYFFRDIAIILFNQGLNVVAIRTSGNGSQPHHLRNVSFRDWIEDMNYGKKLAIQYGERIILGGMSLGGTLATYATLIKNEYPEEQRAHAILGFSPAIITPNRHRYSCSIFFRRGYEAKKDYGKSVRYPKISNAGTCQLWRLTRKIHGFYRNRDYYDLVDLPMFHVFTEYDAAINFEETLAYARKSPAARHGRSHIVMFAMEEESQFGNSIESLTPQSVVKIVPHLRHASVLMRQTEHDLSEPEYNPHFDLVEKRLIHFLQSELELY